MDYAKLPRTSSCEPPVAGPEDEPDWTPPQFTLLGAFWTIAFLAVFLAAAFTPGWTAILIVDAAAVGWAVLHRLGVRRVLGVPLPQLTGVEVAWNLVVGAMLHGFKMPSAEMKHAPRPALAAPAPVAPPAPPTRCHPWVKKNLHQRSPQRLKLPRGESSKTLRCVEAGSPLIDLIDPPRIVTFCSGMNFRVDLSIFRGPMDLLLYLVRKHEIDVAEVPLAAIAEQFLAHLEVLQELNINDGGDFVEMASTLIEIKSRMVLPRAGEETEEIDVAREELVQRLLEYKKFKDAASMLEDRGREWQQRYTRVADDLPPRKIDPAEQPIHDVELWDLVSAFGRVMRENAAVQPPTIIYDDTPIQVYMQRIHERLVANRRTSFGEMFQPGMHKSAMIGVFLAILELVRHHAVHAEQDGVHGEIWITPGEAFDESLNLAEVDNYGG